MVSNWRVPTGEILAELTLGRPDRGVWAYMGGEEFLSHGRIDAGGNLDQ